MQIDQSFKHKVNSLIDVLAIQAEINPHKTVFRVVKKNEETETITYGRLHQRATQLASYFKKRNLSGERALLLYNSSIEYIESFFGCLYAEVISIPLFPLSSRNSQSTERVESIIKDAQPKIRLENSQSISRAKESMLSGVESINIDLLSLDDNNNWIKPDLSASSTAYLQYTSGSTSAPKGVVVTHENLLHNLELLKNFFDLNEDSVIASWLPFHHDMGLIGIVLQTVYVGATCVIMPPEDFIQRPIRWLQMISKYKATYSGAPNFAYDLCVKNTTQEQLESLDLRSWQIAFNGSEPVRSSTIEQFSDKFSPVGFKAESFYPGYGLAENTLGVTAKKTNLMPRKVKIDVKAMQEQRVSLSLSQGTDAKWVVSCGQLPKEQEVIIVNPDNYRKCFDDEIGEIWIKGKSVAKGYWKNKRFTANNFNAYLSDSMDGPYLRTGDLGFVLHNELYISGRLDDLIILHGQNYYPQDIEYTVENSHSLISDGKIAAFKITKGGKEGVVIVAELDRTFRHTKNIQNNQETRDVIELKKIVKNNIVRQYQIHVHDIAFLLPGGVPVTTSNKIQRKKTKEQYLNNQLKLWRR